MKNKNTFNFKSYCAGALCASFLAVVVYNGILVKDLKQIKNSVNNVTVESTESESKEPETELVQYNTHKTNWVMKLDSGEQLTFKTPKNFYSLTDQYLENLSSYYNGNDVSSDSVIVVGDSDTPYQSKTLINCDKLSDISDMLSQLYGEDYDPSEVVQSEAYIYMTTGKIPDNAADNYKIDEIETFKVGDVEFVAYEVNYDTTYKDETGKEKTENETEVAEDQTVHTQQISCYSKTDDAVEIIIYQTEFNRDEAMKLLKEFCGVK